jgi:S-adenosylmethionine synthetase
VSEGYRYEMCHITSSSMFDECLRGDSHSLISCGVLVETRLVYFSTELTQKPNLILPIPAFLSECPANRTHFGAVFWDAPNETPQLFLLSYLCAHHFARHLSQVRKERICPFLGSNGTSQVATDNEQNGS